MTKQQKLQAAVEKLETRKKSAQLRALLPDIEKRIAAGTSIADIARALSDNGLPITLATLKSYLYRARKAARKAPSDGGDPQNSFDVESSVTRNPGVSSRLYQSPASTQPSRNINTVRCLRQLRRGDIFTRAELSRMLGLTRATVGRAINELIADKLVLETDLQMEEGRPGRPGAGIRLNPQGAYAIGIDISSSALTGILIGLGMQVIEKIILPIESLKNDLLKMVELIAQIPARLLFLSGITSQQLQGICISVPGLIDKTGRVVVAPFLHWRDVPLQTLLAARQELVWPIIVCNDAVAFANAEQSRSNKTDVKNMLLILLAEGLGGAVIQHGQIVKGAHGFAGEFGHMIMSDKVSAASETAFEMLAGYQRFYPWLPENATIEEQMAWIADPANRRTIPQLPRILDKWAEALSAGLLNLIYLFDPEEIILGGPLSSLFPLIASQVQVMLKENILYGYQIPPILVTQFGADGAAIGAASMVLSNLFSLPVM
ncbi:ROK family transcriptional regulator [Kosakonia sp. H02]|nr:ROK family transcriptional regulator [Kosakonia sp. H02]